MESRPRPPARVPGLRYAIDPLIHLYAERSAADGTVAVLVEATHFQGGFARHFGPLERGGEREFAAQVTGTDLAGPDGGRTQAIVVETRRYDLGRLEAGAYTFTARSGDAVPATLRLGATRDGQLTSDTPTQPGPYGGPDTIHA